MPAHPGLQKAYDALILGAGPAGLSAARALAQRFPDARIALIEEGGSTPAHRGGRLPVLQRVPLLQPFLQTKWGGRSLSGKHMRFYQSENESGLDGRTVLHVAGCGVGGDTLVNDMKAVRPTMADVDGWELPGWSWRDVYPFFLNTVYSHSDPSHAEDAAGFGMVNSTPLAAVHHADRSVVDAGLNIRFYEACEAAGMPSATSFNQGTADGFSFYESLVSRRKHERKVFGQELAMRFVTEREKPLQEEEEVVPGIDLRTQTWAKQLLFEGRRVTGVLCRLPDGQVEPLRSRKVVVALGPLGSPALLLRSGIGPKGKMVDNVAVGENLIVSSSIATQFVMKADPTTNAMMPKAFHWRNARHLWRQWEEFREHGTGIFSSFCEGGTFTRSTPEAIHPDISVDFYRHPLFLPGGNLLSNARRLLQPLGLSFTATHHYPRSRGRVTWEEEKNAVRVHFGLLSDESQYDLQRMDDGLQWISRITAPLLPSSYYSDEKHQPVSPFYYLHMRMTHPSKSLKTEKDVSTFIKQHTVPTGQLYGTCSLGTVVEPSDLTVKGVEGVHVADASIVPKPTVATQWMVSAAIGARVASYF